jgi:hypothetical protein
MKVTVELEKEDFDAMHDVIFDITEVKPTNEQIQKLWDEMPECIKGTAYNWGCSDTVFRDNMYDWLEEHYNEGNIKLDK